MSADESTLSTEVTSDLTANSDKQQPVDTDGVPIIWDGNDATIAGTLNEVFKFLKRKGLLQTFIQHHAVPVKGGRLAVDSYDTVQFYENEGRDPRGTPKNICPPTPQRVSEYLSLIHI